MASPTKDHPPKPSQTASTKSNRLPAPTLFVGPPSRNTSQLSIPRPENLSATRDPLSRQKSALSRAPESPSDTQNAQTTRLRKDSEKSVDRRWRAMQQTLDEVSATAQTGNGHIFGASHAAALDELRRAQVELARAWGRGSEEGGLMPDENEIGGSVDGAGGFSGVESIAGDRMRKGRQRGGTDASASTVLSDESLQTETGSGGGKSEGRSLLEDETAEDIRKAGERRAANERYFAMVEGSVQDVVQKLGVVAGAMRGVEAESRSLWGGSESLGSSGDADEEGREEVSAVK